MKNFLIVVFIFAGITVRAQKPVFPKPNSTDNIPFGKKLPMPAVKDISWLKNNPYYQQSRDIQAVTYDTLNKQYSTNRPGERQFNYNLHAKPGGTQSSTKPSGGGFHITKDINTLAESYPANMPANSRYSFAVLNNITYFSADDGIHGRELWRSDGTAAGTYMVTDIVAGIGPSNPDGIIAANGRVFFSAYSDAGGIEPWSSDGTPGGTYQLADIAYANYGSNPNQFVKAGGYVYFVATTDISNSELWRTDGTPWGTSYITNIYWNNEGYYIQELSAVNDMVFFIAYTWNYGYQLFKSDGTPWGTDMVKPVGLYWFRL